MITSLLRSVAVAGLLFSGAAVQAETCGNFGANPYSFNGCTSRDSYGNSYRLQAQPFSSGYRVTPEPRYQQAPSNLPGGLYSYPRY